MYACLDVLNDKTKSLCTIEDPVERRVDGVNQIQVDSRIEFGFVEALRGVLRQDPNVMMVGEIRDPETAHIACRAGFDRRHRAQHASRQRLGLDHRRLPRVRHPADVHRRQPGRHYLAALLRKVCSRCRQTYHPDAATAEFLGVPPDEATSRTAPWHRLRPLLPHRIYGTRGRFQIRPSTRTCATPFSRERRTPRCSTSPSRRGCKRSKAWPKRKSWATYDGGGNPPRVTAFNG